MGIVNKSIKKIYKTLRRKLKREYAVVALVLMAVGGLIYEGNRMNLNYTRLLTVIAEGESRGNYNAYFSQPNNTDVQFTQMTVQEVIAWQDEFIKKGNLSSAVGKYQFINTTLQGLISEHEIPLTERFDEQLQDRLAIYLLERRGVYEYARGRISAEEFAYNIAKEWAALPTVKGNKPEASYYAGDGLNEALIKPEQVLSAIDSLRS